jgi:RNA polymerase sigma-70 factor (TIGR02943 family)
MDLVKQQDLATQWVNEFADILYSYAVQRVNDSAAAKDLVQETFLAAWRNVNNYTGEASVKTWLFTILKNKIIDQYRKTASRQTVLLHAKSDDDDYFFDAADHWVAAANPNEWRVNYNSKIEAKEFYIVLENCKSKLKEVQQAVFSMKYLDELDSDEICKTLSLSAANYWVLMHRAKTQLRACLEKNWFML